MFLTVQSCCLFYCFEIVRLIIDCSSRFQFVNFVLPVFHYLTLYMFRIGTFLLYIAIL